jgi:hypothetical protein
MNTRISISIKVAPFIAGIICSTVFATEQTSTGIYGYSGNHQCVEVLSTIERLCGNAGTFQCTVYLEDTEEVVPAYAMQPTEFVCALPLRKQ